MVEIKTNAWFFAILAWLVIVGAGGLLSVGYANEWDMKAEEKILLVGAMATAGGAFIAMGVQAMTPNPPNPHEDELAHQVRMRELDLEELRLHYANGVDPYECLVVCDEELESVEKEE